METKINSFCWPEHSPDSDHQRAGSEPSRAYLNSEKEQIQRPRIRHMNYGEVKLAAYQATSSQRNLFTEVVSAMSEGISSRGITRNTKEAMSKKGAMSDAPYRSN